MSEWISVKDKVPDYEENSADEFDDVLILFKRICNKCGHDGNEKYHAVGYYHRSSKHFGEAAWSISEKLDNDYLPDDHKHMIEVTHWMPLPEPPHE